GEALGIEERLQALGDRIQRRVREARGGGPPGGEGVLTAGPPVLVGPLSAPFCTASLLFCVGPLAVVGAIQDGLTGDYEALATKAMLDGFASIALSATLGWGAAVGAVTRVLYPR